MKYLLAWLALGILIAVGIGSVNIPDLYRLDRSRIQTKGTIVELRPKTHNTVLYRYTVNEKSFLSSDRMGNPSWAVGQAVTVCYAPDRPEISRLGYVRSMLWNELIFVGAVAIFVSGCIVSHWSRKHRPR